MISLRPRSMESIVEILNTRQAKFPIILDLPEVQEVAKRAIRRLNDIMFNPRTAMLENPGTRYDATDLSIDEICRVLYPPLGETNFLFDELGIIPFISQQARMTTLEGVVDYLALKNTINLMNRQMELDGDFEYYPPFIQFRRAYSLVMVEYLPYLNPDFVDPETQGVYWNLYENEFSYVLEKSWILLNRHNAEAVAGATYLGVGKEYEGVLNYWKVKEDELDKQFKDSSIITYLV